MRYYAEVTAKVAFDTDKTNKSEIQNDINSEIQALFKNSSFPDFENDDECFVYVLELESSEINNRHRQDWEEL